MWFVVTLAATALAVVWSPYIAVPLVVVGVYAAQRHTARR
jgi:hypothetical protein